MSLPAEQVQSPLLTYEPAHRRPCCHSSHQPRKTPLRMCLPESHSPSVSVQSSPVRRSRTETRLQVSPAHHHLRSEEHTSELQSRGHLVCRLLLEKKKTSQITTRPQYTY